MAQTRAEVAAALSEGFCPEGHPLQHGNGLFGTCETCGLTWTIYAEAYGYDRRNISGTIRVTRVRPDGQEGYPEPWQAGFSYG